MRAISLPETSTPVATMSLLSHSNSSTCKPCTSWCGWLKEVDSERQPTLAQSQRIPVDQGGHCNARSSQQANTEGAVVQEKRDSYRFSAAAARTFHPAAILSALPNSDVVEKIVVGEPYEAFDARVEIISIPIN